MAQPKLTDRGTLIAVAAILAAGVAIGWSLRPADAPEPAASAPGVRVPAGVSTPEQDTSKAPSPPAVPLVSGADIARLATQSMEGPAATRASAIAALAHAPSAEAVPVLKRVLLNGDPGTDRPLALASLRELALTQGDEDGAIRAAVREAIYHGDDEALAGSAQAALDDIDRDARPAR